MFEAGLDRSGALNVPATLLVQTGETCAHHRLQVLLSGAYPQLMLKTGTGERRGKGGKDNKGGRKIKRL